MRNQSDVADVMTMIFILLQMMLSMHKHGVECKEQVADQEAFDIAQLGQEHENMSAEQQATFLESRQLIQGRPIVDEMAQAQLPPASATFARQLMQLNQMTITKAIALVRRFPTPHTWSRYLMTHELTPQVGGGTCATRSQALTHFPLSPRKMCCWLLEQP
jgi:hypothetical protein